MNVEIITAVKKRMKEELLPRQMEKLEIVLHEVFQEQENKKEKKNLVKKFINVKRDSAVQWQQGQLTRGCPPSRCRFFWDTQRLTPPCDMPMCNRQMQGIPIRSTSAKLPEKAVIQPFSSQIAPINLHFLASYNQKLWIA